MEFDAQRVKEELAAREYEMQTFSRKIGLSGSTVQQVIGRGSCGIDTLDKIACALGLHYTELVREAEDEGGCGKQAPTACVWPRKRARAHHRRAWRAGSEQARLYSTAGH